MCPIKKYPPEEGEDKLDSSLSELVEEPDE